VLRLRDLIFDFQPAEAGTVLDDWLDGADFEGSNYGAYTCIRA
jgi:hypothetical protein